MFKRAGNTMVKSNLVGERIEGAKKTPIHSTNTTSIDLQVANAERYGQPYILGSSSAPQLVH